MALSLQILVSLNIDDVKKVPPEDSLHLFLQVPRMGSSGTHRIGGDECYPNKGEMMKAMRNEFSCYIAYTVNIEMRIMS